MKSFKEHMLPMNMARKNAIVGIREEDIEENITKSKFYKDRDRKGHQGRLIAVGVKSVSYTHLTLPTILLV